MILFFEGRGPEIDQTDIRRVENPFAPCWRAALKVHTVSVLDIAQAELNGVPLMK